MKEFRVKTTPATGFALIDGRNGEYDIAFIQISHGSNHSFIDGISPRGKRIRGGFMIPKQMMLELARRLALEHPAVKRLLKAARMFAAQTHYGSCQLHSRSKKRKCTCPVGDLANAINNLYKQRRTKQ